MTCLPSLNGCNHNESVSLVETKRSSVEEKLSLIHFYLFSSQTCLYKVEQNLLTDAARPGSVTAGRLLTCGALIWRIPVENVPFHQEASVSSTNMLKNQPFYFQTPVSSALSCVRRLFLSSRGLSTVLSGCISSLWHHETQQLSS